MRSDSASITDMGVCTLPVQYLCSKTPWIDAKSVQIALRDNALFDNKPRLRDVEARHCARFVWDA